MQLGRVEQELAFVDDVAITSGHPMRKQRVSMRMRQLLASGAAGKAAHVTKKGAHASQSP